MKFKNKSFMKITIINIKNERNKNIKLNNKN